MEHPAVHWFREALKVHVRYLAVGVALVPWGIAYALMATVGFDHWLVLVVLLGGGLLTARRAWDYVAGRQPRSEGKLRSQSYIDSPGTGQEVTVMAYPPVYSGYPGFARVLALHISLGVATAGTLVTILPDTSASISAAGAQTIIIAI